MKKIVSLMLALVMLLSASLVSAEQAEKVPRPSLVLASSVSVERNAAGELMSALGFGEDRRSTVDAALAVINKVNDQLTIAENGIEYRVAMNGMELVRFTGGMTDGDIVLLSSLIPNYALTLSADFLGKISMAAGLLKGFRARLKNNQRRTASEKALEVLVPYIKGFMDQTASAVQPGAQEKGVFEFGEGVSYNTRQPIRVDSQVFKDVLNDMISKIVRDKKAVFALKLLDLPVEMLQKLPFVSERLPAIDMNLYSHTDDSGAEISSDRCISVAITLPGQDAVSATLDLHTREKGIDAMLSIPGSHENDSVSATFSFAPFDQETAMGSIALSVDANGLYSAFSGIITPNADGSALTLSNVLFLQDPAKPLASATTIIKAADTPLDLSIGKREVIPIESLFGKSGENMRNKLKYNLMFSGLRIIAAATKAVPEVTVLLNMMNGETETAADVKESEAAKGAA